MALLETPFEVLHNSTQRGYAKGDGGNVNILDSEASALTMDNLIEKSKKIYSQWEYTDVDCEAHKVSLTDDFNFQFVDKQGREHNEDITDFAFQELCTRVGVPAQYVKKCYNAGKKDLALSNFRSWAGEFDGGLKLMRLPDEDDSNKRIVRAVTSEKFKPWESYKVLSNLKRTVNMDRWVITDSHLSADKMVLRFIDKRSPIYEDRNSKLFVGVCVRTSDVGKGSLSMKMFVYRQACTNGMVLSKGDATLYKQAHSGSNMTESKVDDFIRGMLRAEKYGGTYAKAIENCVHESMNSTMFELWLEKTKNELKLSKKATESLGAIIDNNYDRNVWGIINGVTELSHEFTLDRRLEMENWAGNVFMQRA